MPSQNNTSFTGFTSNDNYQKKDSFPRSRSFRYILGKVINCYTVFNKFSLNFILLIW